MLSVIIVTLLEIPTAAAVKLSGSMILPMWSSVGPVVVGFVGGCVDCCGAFVPRWVRRYPVGN